MGEMESDAASSFTHNLGIRWTAVVISRPRLVYVKTKRVPAPIKITGGLGACLGASEKGKYPNLHTVSAKINVLAISMKTVDRDRYTTSIVVEIFHKRGQIVGGKNRIKQDSSQILTCFRNKIGLNFLTLKILP